MSDDKQQDSNTVENTQASTEKYLTLNVDINEANIIIAALQELPHKVVDTLVKKIYQQASEQLG